jgi:DNA-binding beta-propeller fold protein YncE
MYIVVSTSSQLEIVDLVTGKSIQRIPIFDGNKPRQPRKIAFCKNKAFLCSFDGTVEVIDTTSLTIETVIKVGRNPDGVAVVGNKIYISNSGGLDNPNYDKTVLVIDYNTLTEIKKIPVLINPTYMATDNYGDVYVVSRGNYDNVKMRLQVIDSKTDTVKKTFNDFEALNLTIKGDTAYVYYYDFTSGSGSKILLLNVKDETIIRQNFITDNTKIETVYGIAVHPLSGDVFITDAHNFTNMGEVFCFGANGKKKYSFKAGLNPSYMGFVNVARVDTVK